VWTHSKGLPELPGLTGYGPSYGTGGYVVMLPINRTEAFRELVFLRNNLWIDRGTRAVAVEFNLYNTNTKMASTVRCMLEFFPSSYIVPWSRVYSFRVNLYDAYLDQVRVPRLTNALRVFHCFVLLCLPAWLSPHTQQFRLVGELIYLGMWIYYLQKEARRVWWTSPKYMYLLDTKNFFEIVMIVFSLTTVVYWIKYTTSSVVSGFNVNSETFVELFPVRAGCAVACLLADVWWVSHTQVGESFTTLFSLVGFLTLLKSLKVFRFLSISKKMNSLWLTLKRASQSLLYFALGSVRLHLQLAFGVVVVTYRRVSFGPASW
jgi:hypothetical protein